MINNDEKILRSFLSEFTIVSQNKNDLFSILIPLILSKQFFKRKDELKAFVETVLELKDIKDYLYSSRTYLLGRIMKEVSSLTIEEAVHLNKKVLDSIMDIIKSNSTSEDNAKDHKKMKVSYFSNWYKFLNSEE